MNDADRPVDDADTNRTDDRPDHPADAPAASDEGDDQTTTDEIRTRRLRIRPDSAGIPATMKARDDWVAWRCHVPDDATPGDHVQKIPLNPQTGRPTDVTEPDAGWAFTDAWACYDDPETDADGIGYVFTETSPYVGIDLDDCRDPETGTLEPMMADLVKVFDSYTYVSTSGTGVHIINVVEGPQASNRFGRIEIYAENSFFAVTGVPLDSHV